MSVSRIVSEIWHDFKISVRSSKSRRKWRRSIDHVPLSISHCKYCTILYRFRDKARCTVRKSQFLSYYLAFDAFVMDVPVRILSCRLLRKN